MGAMSWLSEKDGRRVGKSPSPSPLPCSFSSINPSGSSIPTQLLFPVSRTTPCAVQTAITVHVAAQKLWGATILGLNVDVLELQTRARRGAAAMNTRSHV